MIYIRYCIYIVFLFVGLSKNANSQETKQVFNFEHKEFNKLALEYLDSLDGFDSTIVLFKSGCNGLFYFLFKGYNSYPDHLRSYLDSNNKRLLVKNHSIPLITDSDYNLYFNQGFINNFFGYLDGTVLGKSNRFIIVMENDRGTFGRIVPKEELLGH